jgi:hypothetical protein
MKSLPARMPAVRAGILAGIAFTGTRARDTLVFVGKSSEAPLSKCRGMIPFSCRE